MLRVTVLEIPARFGEPERALAEADALLARGPATDLVLFPEASLTGYVSPKLTADLRPFAEPLEGPRATTVKRLGDLARVHRAHVVGPLVLREGERFHNAMVAVAPDGRVVATYRKRHPWYVEAWASPGTEPLGRFEVNGARVAIAICFDVHFLAAESAADLRASDVLLFPSAWVEEDGDTRAELFPRLAREFDLAIVNANWGKGVPAIPGQGGSRIVGRNGAPVALARGAPGASRIDAELDVG